MSAELSSPSNGAPMGPIGPQLIILVSRVKGQLGPHSVKYLLRYQKVPEIWYLRRIRHMAVQGAFLNFGIPILENIKDIRLEN